MSFFQENKAITGLLALGGIVFLGGVGWSVVNHLSLSKEKTKFATLEKSYVKLATDTKPSPEKDNIERLQATLAKANEVYEKQKSILFGDSSFLTEGVPADSLKSKFNLQTFITKETQLFTSSPNLSLEKGAEFFGFEHYIAVKQDGPSLPQDIAKVHLQRQVIERVLNHLLAAAKPDDAKKTVQESLILKSVRRTRVESPEEGKDQGGVVRGIFNIAPEVTARVKDVVDTVGFEFVFVAKTETLRRLVNSIVAEQLPWVIRSIEVKRFQGDPGADPQAAPTTGTQNTPVIVDTYSQFTLTLEVISLAKPAPAVAPEAPAPGSAPKSK